ncbi:MAG: toll/interleukin-1 receptor domain-containing protein [Pirellulaceae bacterium]
MSSVFFSYSHKDEEQRNELEVHLAVLKRQGIIDAWYDRRILAGDEFGNVISENLEVADIILLLVSPYFLASKYCYEIEMTRAMERHEAGKTRVIPVILEPCDWHSAPFGKLVAIPTDGKPVSKHPNRHDAYLEITQAIRTIAERTMSPSPAPPKTRSVATAAPVVADARSSNLRVKKSFTDHDRDTFRESSFEYIAKFFENSLVELEKRNEGITTKFRRINANHFTAAIYRDGKSVGQCGIRLDMGMMKQIAFSFEAQSTNSYNESLSVGADEQALFLKSQGMSRMTGGGGSEKLTQQGGAEIFWSLLIEPLQR